MPYPISRRTALLGGLGVAASAGGLYTATTALAGTGVGAQAFQLRWSPDPAVDKLNAFAGVEDDRSHSHKGVQHIFADASPAQYRFLMHVQDRDGADRQRQEVRGMQANGGRVDMHKGETWRYNYQMFIPDTLKGTTNFTHIFQVKHSGVGSPVVTVSLGRSGSNERIEMRMYGSGGGTIGTTDLAKLRNKWIDIEIEITALPDPGRRYHGRRRVTHRRHLARRRRGAPEVGHLPLHQGQGPAPRHLPAAAQHEGVPEQVIPGQPCQECHSAA